jgi:hypothetical protein
MAVATAQASPTCPVTTLRRLFNFIATHPTAPICTRSLALLQKFVLSGPHCLEVLPFPLSPHESLATTSKLCTNGKATLSTFISSQNLIGSSFFEIHAFLTAQTDRRRPWHSHGHYQLSRFISEPPSAFPTTI